MKQVPIFGIGYKAKSANVTAQTRVNMYLEILPDKDKTQAVAYGTPGLTLLADLGDTPFRCLQSLGDYVYGVHRGTFYQITNAGVATSKGTLLTTTGRCGIDNNGSQIIVVDGTYGYTYTIATDTFAQIADADFPGADTVTFNDGYFIVNEPDSGRFFLSALYDGTSWDALDFATAESNPDNLVSVVADHGELILLGDISTEFWSNTGNVDFPYTRMSGAAVEWGLAARWSIAKFDNSLIWLAKNRMGEVQVTRLAGYQPQRVSTFDIENIINSYSSVSDATGFSYLHNGHPFYQINFPTAGESWLYDGASNVWSKMVSSGMTRHRAEIATYFLNRTIVSDNSNGRLYNIDGNEYTENGEEIVSEITTKHVAEGLERIFIHALQVDIEPGVGLATGQGADPQIMLQVSRDGGHTWGAEMWRGMGKIGKYKTRALWTRLGMSRDFVFRFRISDPVKRAILGAYISV